ncbi:hypothetical protein ACFSND_08840 [Brevibacillus brevis]|uniref:hypothetical protein n=1 Tax=Brevibacillus brevis TaxID=1393 RepID=UPI003638B95E
MISTSPWVDDKEHLQEILARDEFNLPQGSGENWIQRAMDFVIELIADLLSGPIFRLVRLIPYLHSCSLWQYWDWSASFTGCSAE